jgi:amidase
MNRFLCALAMAALPAHAAPVEVTEASIPELQRWMTEGKTTSKALVQAYLARIKAYDAKGPRLNAILAVNPNAVKEAEALDRERAAKGARGPLHGIPIILKDNFDTADMPTTAGSIALVGFVPPRDAFQVRKLREAGAVILAKSNLHEFAMGWTTTSSLGGQTRNPYDSERTPGGSSGGTGAAVAASYAAAGMGTDTCGSIRLPASHNSLVGLRPTKGLSSIAGLVPFSSSWDTAGPLARSIGDLAIVLDATIGEDPDDPTTKVDAGKPRPKFADALDASALKGARLGVLTALFGNAPEDEEVERVDRAALDEMKAQGATLVEVAVPDLEALLKDSPPFDYEFKADLAAYLEARNAPVRSISELLQKGLYGIPIELKLKRRAVAKGRDSAEYQTLVQQNAQLQKAVLKVMNDQKLDALVYPTVLRKAPRIREAQEGVNCWLAGATGLPALSVPAGFTDDGLPVGVELLGRPFADARLVALGFAYEKAAPHRRAPPHTPALVAKPIVFEVTATGAELVPPVETRAKASARFSFDPLTNELSYAITLSNVKADDVLFANLHRAAKDSNGPVMVRITKKGLQKLQGAEVISEDDRQSLLAGELYLGIATRQHPAGELRAQLMRR